MITNKNEKCLEEDDIERYLNKDIMIAKDVTVVEHISKCQTCFEQYSELSMFHLIFDAELNRPISSRVLNLVQCITEN